MPGPNENEVLGFEVQADTSRAQKAIGTFYKGMSKAIKHNSVEYQKLTKDVTRYDRMLSRLHSKAVKSDVTDLKHIKEKIKRIENLRVVDETRLKRVAKLTEKGMEAEKEAAKKGLEKTEKRIESFKKAGEALAAPLHAILNKDLPGAFESSGKLVGGILEHSFKGAGKALSFGGKKFGEWGSKSLAKGAARKEAGKGGGGGMMAMGKTLQGVGKLAESIGPLVKTLSAVGPIIATMSTVIMSVIKLFVDAEAQAKGMNKEILATAGSAEFFENNMQNSAAAGEELDEVLGNIRKSATSLDNLDWGISKEQHMAVMTSLTAEGVSLRKLNQRFDELGKGTIKTEGYVKDFGSMVQMTVGYSRAFGVSLGEMGQLTGEMMGDIGMSADGVEAQFEYLNKSAQDAGVATNKFFGIIRSFSADLTLFTLRMEDITKVTRVLMKTMDPRQAQKFLQTLTAHFKGMGLRERLKATIIGGTGKTKGILQKDVTSRLDALANDLQNSLPPGSGKELVTLIKSKDPKKREKLTKWMAKNQDKLDGKQRSAILDAARMQGKLDTGNAVDIASALKDASPIAAIEQLQAQSQTLFHKPLEELTGVERIAAESAIGMSDDQVDQLSKMTAGIDQMKADLVDKLKEHKELTADEKKQLKKLGIDESKAGADALLQAKTGNDIWASMDMDQKDMLESGDKTLKYEKDIAGNQTSMLDKLAILVDFIMNQVYDILVDAVDGLESLFPDISGFLTKVLPKSWTKGMNLSPSVDAATKKQIRLSKDKDLMKALAEHGGSQDDLQKAMLNVPVFQDIGDNMGKLYTEFKTTTDDKRKADLKAQIGSATSRADTAAFINPKEAEEALKTTTLGADKIKAVMADMKDNGTAFSAALAGAGATEDERVAAMQAMYKKMTPYELALNKAGLQSAGWGAPAPQAGAADAQQQAAAKANTPGSAGVAPGAASTATTAPAVRQALSTVVQHSTGAGVTAPPPGGAAAKAAPVEVADGPTADQSDLMISNLSDLESALRRRGIKLDKSFLMGDYQRTLRDAMYDALSEALYEFAILTNMTAVDDWMKASQKYNVAMGAGLKGMLPLMQASASAKGYSATGHATGGFVTGINGGLANISPAPGEGLASIGKGERILPAGAGGGGGVTKVVLELKGDMLNQIIKARATEAAAEHDYKKRFR